jgi:hypothetical protein
LIFVFILLFLIDFDGGVSCGDGEGKLVESFFAGCGRKRRARHVRACGAWFIAGQALTGKEKCFQIRGLALSAQNPFYGIQCHEKNIPAQ